MRYYPVFLDLEGQLCVVIGDGKLAAEKVAGLRGAGADVRAIPSRDYRPGVLAGARLVVDASDDPEINRQAWQEAEAAGILINVVDRPPQCRFIAPAIVKRDPLVIAISTSGESPFLAAALRARLERWLGEEWGPFTALVGRIRRDLRERGVPLPEQTRIYKRLLTSDVRKLFRTGSRGAAQQLAAVISRTGRVNGRVALVGAGPGDPDLLTIRARELLAEADFVLHDALVSRDTLTLSGPDARLVDVGKRGGRASTAQAEITARMIELAREGHDVVRLKGGDPFVFGRGGEELRDLLAAGIDVVVVPGVSSAIAAPSVAGIPVTMRGFSSSVAVTTAEGKSAPSRIRELAAAADTLVVLMVHSRLKQVTSAIAEVLGPDRPAAVISNATLPGQKVVTGTIRDAALLALRGGLQAPATLVVGEVVAQAASNHRQVVDLVSFG
ncbi:MAG TPA: uroporphyrinogen-III C-methyltransferase [Verrucomicrobiae bacterium]|nr:uroporphyrinogen-III C-methyltransferase [Verrucomicrobiae bacterium]